MIRFRLGPSVFQFRTASLIVALCLTVTVLLIYSSTRDIQNVSPKGTLSDHKLRTKNEFMLIEQRLQKLEEELQKNRDMLGKVKDAVREMLKGTPAISSQKSNFYLNMSHFLNHSQTSVPLSTYDCGICKEPAARADIQMSEVYRKLKFDNPDGGAWKQGWDVQYNASKWTQKKKLKVFVVPHSHNDPGWLKTFEKYFHDQTRHILNNMVTKLREDSRRRFIWAEVSFFALWWESIDNNAKQLVKRYISDGQLEIVTGGWVMSDEASTHYYAIIDQLVEGHQWLEHNLDYRPQNGWSIDPFGLSSTMAYILRRMALENMVIQRVHYSVKKYLAQQHSLEFLWRQGWDQNHTTDILCHMMPFYSYDVPHSCGPNPKVCCQFDFKRLPGNKVNCPWKIPPVPITDKNVMDRSWLILDQYRKKSELYNTSVVLIPLGDDFRYDKSSEWDLQFRNYQKLFDYMNGRTDWNVQAQFGTLDDYFTAVREETGLDSRNQPNELHSLIGDFFTYADRDDHYWSGYYTSRPFYKNMDRTLEAHLRGAEILFSLLWSKITKEEEEQISNLENYVKSLTESRRTLGLFQHHDGITGTSKDFVVVDYANRMFNSLQVLQKTISKLSQQLLIFGSNKSTMDTNTILLEMDTKKSHYNTIPEKINIKLNSVQNVRTLVLYNSLAHSRKELISCHVTESSVEVRDALGNVVPSQINPVFHGGVIVDEEYELVFLAEIPALGLVTYTLHLMEDKDIEKTIVILYNFDSAPESRKFSIDSMPPPQEFMISSSTISAVFSGADGMLRRIIMKEEGTSIDARIQFLLYGTRPKGKDRSGAYLFLPDAAAQNLKYSRPKIRILKGPLMSEVTVFLPEVEHHIRVKNTAGLDSAGLDIYNIVDVTREVNKELIMRFYTNITNNNQDFYTDLNGFQITRRQTFDKLPIQANVYPMTTMCYLQDNNTRFTLLTGQSLGVAALKPGWLEVFLDRRLNQDDNRGLQQGVTDNRRTPSQFRVLVEKQRHNSQQSRFDTNSYPSLLSLHASLSLLHPVFIMIRQLIKTGNEVLLRPTYSPIGTPLPCDMHLLNLRILVNSSLIPTNATALFLHRMGFDCSYRMWGTNCSLRNGTINISDTFPNYFGSQVEEMSLSLMYSWSKFSKDSNIQLPPMEIVVLKLNRS